MLSGCVSAPPTQFAANDWPENLPPLQSFEAYYMADTRNQQLQSKNDYLTWVKRFYKGWVYRPHGWHWMTKSALEQAPEQSKAQLQENLAWLGERISAEWAKDDRSRTINSEHMMIWADALKVALRKDAPVELTAQVKFDVKQLLSGELKPDTITLDRYLDSPPVPLVVENSDYQDPFEF